MKKISEIISNMREVAPPRERWLDDNVLADLCELTQVLIIAKTGPGDHRAWAVLA